MWIMKELRILLVMIAVHHVTSEYDIAIYLTGETQIQGCEDECSAADGFFRLPESEDQCFKFFVDENQKWEDARSFCETNGLELAKPKDAETAVALRKYIVEKYDDGSRDDPLAWMGARGTGSEINWIRDEEVLSGNNSAWHPDQPDWKGKRSGHCLELMARGRDVRNNPTGPYWMASCSDTNKSPVCELVN